MKPIYFITIILLAGLALPGCSRSKATPEEYVAYVNGKENGLTQTKEVSPYVISVQYRPLPFEFISNTDPDMLNAQGLEKALSDNKGLEYYLMKIGSTDKKTDALANGIDDTRYYQERISQLISGIETRMKLVAGTDTFPCVMHHYERNYQMADFHNVLLVFETGNIENNSDKTIIYNDDMLGIGRLSFTFSRSDIEHVPQLTL